MSVVMEHVGPAALQ